MKTIEERVEILEKEILSLKTPAKTENPYAASSVKETEAPDERAL